MFLDIFRYAIYFPLLNLLTFLIYLTPGHYAAVGIILLTLIVRFILYIPSRNAAQVQRKTQQIAPLLEELKLEYGDDRNGLAQAQMELYKKNNINPFGSCITLLVQLPILITLYYAIRDGLTTNSEFIYSWVARPEFINTNFFGINLVTPDHTYILPIIAAALQFVQMRLTIPNVKREPGKPLDPAAASQRIFQYVIPATTLLFAAQFPAGVALYWIVTTAFSAVQQTYVNRDKYKIEGVDAALKEADTEHPEHKKRSPKVIEEIKEETSSKGGVNVTVRKKK